MGKTIPFDKETRGNRGTKYTDVEYIQGLLDDRRIQYALYRHWESYFESHCNSEFFLVGDMKKQIVHNSYKVLWNKVRTKAIYVEDGVLKGKNGEPFTSNLTTYLMSIAKNNNKELVRDINKDKLIGDFTPHTTKNDCDDDGYTIIDTVASEPLCESPFLDSSYEMVMREIVADTIANMSERCSQILKLFYYEEMKLDRIMDELKSFTSKDALKTAKNKCMDKLKVAAREKYRNYLNS